VPAIANAEGFSPGFPHDCAPHPLPALPLDDLSLQTDHTPLWLVSPKPSTLLSITTRLTCADTSGCSAEPDVVLFSPELRISEDLGETWRCLSEMQHVAVSRLYSSPVVYASGSCSLTCVIGGVPELMRRRAEPEDSASDDVDNDSVFPWRRTGGRGLQTRGFDEGLVHCSRDGGYTWTAHAPLPVNVYYARAIQHGTGMWVLGGDRDNSAQGWQYRAVFNNTGEGTCAIAGWDDLPYPLPFPNTMDMPAVSVRRADGRHFAFVGEGIFHNLTRGNGLYVSEDMVTWTKYGILPNTVYDTSSRAYAHQAMLRAPVDAQGDEQVIWMARSTSTNLNLMLSISANLSMGAKWEAPRARLFPWAETRVSENDISKYNSHPVLLAPVVTEALTGEKIIVAISRKLDAPSHPGRKKANETQYLWRGHFTPCGGDGDGVGGVLLQSTPCPAGSFVRGCVTGPRDDVCAPCGACAQWYETETVRCARGGGLWPATADTFCEVCSDACPSGTTPIRACNSTHPVECVTLSPPVVPPGPVQMPQMDMAKGILEQGSSPALAAAAAACLGALLLLVLPAAVAPSTIRDVCVAVQDGALYTAAVAERWSATRMAVGEVVWSGHEKIAGTGVGAALPAANKAPAVPSLPAKTAPVDDAPPPPSQPQSWQDLAHVIAVTMLGLSGRIAVVALSCVLVTLPGDLYRLCGITSLFSFAIDGGVNVWAGFALRARIARLRIMTPGAMQSPRAAVSAFCFASALGLASLVHPATLLLHGRKGAGARRARVPRAVQSGVGAGAIISTINRPYALALVASLVNDVFCCAFQLVALLALIANSCFPTTAPAVVLLVGTAFLSCGNVALSLHAMQRASGRQCCRKGRSLAAKEAGGEGVADSDSVLESALPSRLLEHGLLNPVRAGAGADAGAGIGMRGLQTAPDGAHPVPGKPFRFAISVSAPADAGSSGLPTPVQPAPGSGVNASAHDGTGKLAATAATTVAAATARPGAASSHAALATPAPLGGASTAPPATSATVRQEADEVRRQVSEVMSLLQITAAHAAAMAVAADAADHSSFSGESTHMTDLP
jgi:hypothetical protein